MATANYPIAHPHSIGYGLGYLVGWLLILSPIALLAWLALAVIGNVLSLYQNGQLVWEVQDNKPNPLLPTLIVRT